MIKELVEKPYHQYALDVRDGKVVACKYIKLAVERYFKWLEREDIEFYPEKVDKVIRFIAKIKHYKGECAGQPLILQPWQTWVLANIYGFYWKGTERRVTKNVYLEVARKNGKTSLAAGICLYSLIADGEKGAEVDLIANTRAQAKLCFEDCEKFARTIDPKGKVIKRYREKIKFPHTDSFLQVLSSDSEKQDGHNSHLYIADEAHCYPNSKLFDVMKSSQGFRRNPLAIIITTAGLNLHCFCYEMRKTNIEILHGIKEDDTQFTAIYTLDDGDDWEDPKNWIKPNPNFGVSVQAESIPEQIRQAKNNPILEASVRTKHFNQWLGSNIVWIPHSTLVENSKPIELSDMKDLQIWMGVDLSAVSDLTAVSACWELSGKYHFKTWYFLPESALSDSPNSEMYKGWVRKGLLNITPGNVVDYDYITNTILKINEQCYINKIFYDAWNSVSWAVQCTTLGLPLEPFSQALWHFNRATKGFERLIKSGQVVIDDNEITRWCFSNCTLKFDHNDNCKPIKEQREAKIDGVIAMLQGLGGMIEQPMYQNEIFSI